MKKRILGLDPGTNSLGWAVVDENEDGTYELIKKGVLRFNAGAADDLNADTPAAIRRKLRGLRRRFYRRRLRKIELLKVLVENDLCPMVSREDLDAWRYKKIYPMIEDFMQWQKTDEKGNRNPYLFRYLCLTEQLDLTGKDDRYILGRALYHLVQRRGFLSNRKVDISGKAEKESGTDNDDGQNLSQKDETGEIKAGIKQLQKDMADAGCTWLGEYFHLRYVGAIRPNTVRLRTIHTSRQMYIDEFHAICKKQNLAEVFGQDMVDKLFRAIFFQRKLKSQKYTMGHCTFEKKYTRCYASHPDFEEFRMLTFLNNVKVKRNGYDFEFRPLNETERSLAVENILSRKSKGKFDTIAKAIAGKNNYCCGKDDESDKGSKVYEFNYSMDTEVPNCPFIYAMRHLFDGCNWRENLAESYTGMITSKGNVKTVSQAVDDIWHVLLDFEDEENLFRFAKEKLQLDDKKAEYFSSKISFSRDVASLSLRAIRNILPFLRMGLKYSHAVFMAKVPKIMGGLYTKEFEDNLIDGILGCDKKNIFDYVVESVANETKREAHFIRPLIYHPSMTDVYPKVQLSSGKVPQLGSPETRSFRNPTAMKALHQIRYVVNALLAEKIIDRTTTVHVEYPRALNNPAQRSGLKIFNAWMKARKEEAEKKIGEYKTKENLDFTTTEDQILRVVLWLEQKETDIYDGTPLTIESVLGGECDIDHIIPRSMHGDDGQMNKVLTSINNNREVKKKQMPSQMVGYQDMKDNRAYEFYYKRYRDLDKSIKSQHPANAKGKAKRYADMLKRDYYKGKWERFTATKEPEGFSMWQGPGNATITRYLGMYLQSVFYDPSNPKNKQVWIVKSPVTAKLRQMWGLQEEWSEKDRSNHCHHAKDAIVVACAGHGVMQALNEWMRSQDTGCPYKFPLPWPTFVEDMESLHENTVVYYRTKSKFDTFTLRRLKDLEKKYGKGKTKEDRMYKKGLGIRASLYKDTFYAKIKMKDDEQRDVEQVVKRESVEHFITKKGDISKIIDKKVRESIQNWVNNGAQGIPYMDKDSLISIRGTRIKSSVIPSEVKKCRDLSQKTWKQNYLSKNDGNFCCALYKGGKKNSYLLFSNIDVANWMKENKSKVDLHALIPETDAKGLPLYAILDKGTHVIFHNGDKNEVRLWSQEELVEKLWYIRKYEKNGRIGCMHHQCGVELNKIKIGTNISTMSEKTMMELVSSNYYNALVENKDFTISALGEIKIKI